MKWLSFPELVSRERALLGDSFNESLWLDYIDFLDENPNYSFHKMDLLHRAVSTLPTSTLLWNRYFLACFHDKNTLLNLYARASKCLPESPQLWQDYIDLAISLRIAGMITIFESALFHLPFSYHLVVWKRYLRFAQSDCSVPCSVYSRYLAVAEQLDDPVEVSPTEIITAFVTRGSPKEIRELFYLIWQNRLPTRLHPLALSVDALKELATTDVSTQEFESIATESISRFANVECEVLLVLAAFSGKRNLDGKARHYYNRALKAAVSVKEAVDAFNAMCNFESLWLENPPLATPDKVLELHVNLFDKVLRSRPLVINDVKLKQNPNNVDYWLDRVRSFPDSDMLSRIRTYVAGLSTINPLHAAGESSLVTLWVDYVSIYLDQGDFKTASIIFSKAAKSQFASPDDLAEIHILWTESLLKVSDQEALDHVHDVLFHRIPENPHTYRIDDQSKSVQSRLFLSLKLWTFYIDLIQALLGDHQNDMLEKLNEAYEKMTSLKIITIRLIIEHANFLETEFSPDKAFTLYESMLRKFTAPAAKLEIWKVYLDKMMALRPTDTERIRDLFEDCLVEDNLPGDSVKMIFDRFSAFERKNGNLVKAFTVMETALARISMLLERNVHRYSKNRLDKMVDDKIALYGELTEISRGKLRDVPKTRELLSLAAQDESLPTPQTIRFAMEFAQFETEQKEYVRARALYRHIGGMGIGRLYLPIWDKWEKFELTHGNEASYKEMLRYKRAVEKRFAEVEEAKKEVNPLNFIKGETKGGEIIKTNPDAIEMDMDS